MEAANPCGLLGTPSSSPHPTEVNGFTLFTQKLGVSLGAHARLHIKTEICYYGSPMIWFPCNLITDSLSRETQFQFCFCSLVDWKKKHFFTSGWKSNVQFILAWLFTISPQNLIAFISSCCDVSKTTGVEGFCRGCHGKRSYSLCEFSSLLPALPVLAQSVFLSQYAPSLPFQFLRPTDKQKSFHA